MELTIEQKRAIALAKAKVAAQKKAAAPEPEQNQAETLARSLFQGFTFGAGDEIVAGAAAPVRVGMDVARRGTEALSLENLKRQYEGGLNQERSDLETGKEANPVTAVAGEIAGAVANPLARRAMGAPAATRTGRIGQAALGGGVMGSGYGFNTGEGGIENRVAKAVTDGAMGAGIGAASYPVMGALTAAGKMVADPILGALNIGNQGRAASYMGGLMRRGGVSADDVTARLDEAAADGQDMFMVADALGNPGQRALAGITRQPNDQRQLIVEALERRQAGQGERVARQVAEGFDTPVSATRAREAMTAQRAADADVNYAAARQGAQPVNVDNVLAAIDSRLSGTAPGEWAQDSIDGILARYRSRLAGQVGGRNATLSEFDRILGVKQDLQDEIGALSRAGKNNAVRELTRIQRELDAALEGASGGYRQANDTFARQSRAIDAMDTGREAVRPGARAQDTIARFQGMTPAQQSSFRYGYTDPLLAKIENGAFGVNRARPLTSDKFTAEARAMAPNADRMMRQLDRENVMFETRRAATGGSQTAENIADQGDLSGLPAGFMEALLRGQPIQAARAGLGAAGNALAGRNSGTIEQIAQALMSRGPQAREILENANRRQIAEALAFIDRQRMLTAAGVSQVAQ